MTNYLDVLLHHFKIFSFQLMEENILNFWMLSRRKDILRRFMAKIMITELANVLPEISVRLSSRHLSQGAFEHSKNVCRDLASRTFRNSYQNISNIPPGVPSKHFALDLFRVIQPKSPSVTYLPWNFVSNTPLNSIGLGGLHF